MSPSAPRVVTRRAHAKVNVFLRVLGRRDDGFHDLESVVLPISLHDVVTAEDGGPGEPSLVVEGATEPTDDVPSEMARTTSPAERCWPWPNESVAMPRPRVSRVRIDKRIPVAAGLGGGSADAAATLLALNELWHCDLDAQNSWRSARGSGRTCPPCSPMSRCSPLGAGSDSRPCMPRASGGCSRPLGFGVSAADAYTWWDDEPHDGA